MKPFIPIGDPEYGNETWTSRGASSAYVPDGHGDRWSLVWDKSPCLSVETYLLNRGDVGREWGQKDQSDLGVGGSNATRSSEQLQYNAKSVIGDDPIIFQVRQTSIAHRRG